MATDLLKALEQAHLSGLAELGHEEWNVDDHFSERRPQKRAKKSPGTIKKVLEEKFLTPSTCFTVEWINKLQE